MRGNKRGRSATSPGAAETHARNEDRAESPASTLVTPLPSHSAAAWPGAGTHAVRTAVTTSVKAPATARTPTWASPTPRRGSGTTRATGDRAERGLASIPVCDPESPTPRRGSGTTRATGDPDRAAAATKAQREWAGWDVMNCWWQQGFEIVGLSESGGRMSMIPVCLEQCCWQCCFTGSKKYQILVCDYSR